MRINAASAKSAGLTAFALAHAGDRRKSPKDEFHESHLCRVETRVTRPADRGSAPGYKRAFQVGFNMLLGKRQQRFNIAASRNDDQITTAKNCNAAAEVPCGSLLMRHVYGD